MKGVEVSNASTPILKEMVFQLFPDYSVLKAWPFFTGWQMAICSGESAAKK
jgi:hypothetical protein